MPHIAVPEDMPGIRGLLAARPEVARPLGLFTDALLRGPGSLSAGERELIAAYVSALNDCRFCHASHAAIAVCHGQDGALVSQAVQDPESASLSPKLKALLAIANRVRQGGASVRPDDIARAREAEATDPDIHDTVLIAAAFCMFNRYVDGLAATTPVDPHWYRERGQLIAQHGYSQPAPLAHAAAEAPGAA